MAFMFIYFHSISNLYIFYLIFHCGLYCRAVSVTDNLGTKQGNSSVFGSNIRSYNQERVIMI